MKKLTKNYLRRLIVEELQGLSSLTEAEDEGDDIFGGDEAADEEPAEDEAADEEPAEDEGGEDDGGEEEGEADESGEDEGAEDEGGEEEEASEDADGPSDFQIDNEINAVMADFESEALQVAQEQNESKSRLSLARALLEADESEEIAIDIDNFSQNIARLIGNYQNLIDMEQVIFNKAVDFLTDKYGEESATQLEDILATRYDISVANDADPEAEATASYAVGAANAQA
jgi:hypothetical protein